MPCESGRAEPAAARRPGGPAAVTIGAGRFVCYEGKSSRTRPSQCGAVMFRSTWGHGLRPLHARAPVAHLRVRPRASPHNAPVFAAAPVAYGAGACSCSRSAAAAAARATRCTTPGEPEDRPHSCRDTRTVRFRRSRRGNAARFRGGRALFACSRRGCAAAAAHLCERLPVRGSAAARPYRRRAHPRGGQRAHASPRRPPLSHPGEGRPGQLLPAGHSCLAPHPRLPPPPGRATRRHPPPLRSAVRHAAARPGWRARPGRVSVGRCSRRPREASRRRRDA